MNWTGGEYTRAAPSKHGTALQQQKAHFARARAARWAQPKQATQLLSSQAQTVYCGNKRARTEVRTTEQSHGSQPSDCSRSKELHKDDQELRLLEKRQALLHRSDWVGLRAAQPLRITFETEAEKDMIGRRRKVPKKTPAVMRRPLREAQSAEQPVHERLRFARLKPLPLSSAVIAVGSDALGTQTQAFHSGGNQPQQARSDVDDLSEEPMLLDSDDDLFEKETSTQDHAPGLITHHTQSEQFESVRPSEALDYGHDSTSVRGRSESIDQLTSSTPLLEITINSEARTPGSEPLPDITSSEHRRQCGKCWRKALGLQMTSEEDGSNAAVFSFVGTVSTQQPRPAIQPMLRRMPSNARNMLVPPRTGSKDSLQVHLSETSAETRVSTEKPASTSKSLQAMQKLQGPMLAQKQWPSSDAIWRQFIIGDSSGRSQSPTE